MPLYSYQCDTCGRAEDQMRLMDARNDPYPCGHYNRDTDTHCAGRMERSKALEGAPPVHYHGAGFTRTPAVFKDDIAKGHPGANTNWGTTNSIGIADDD